MFYYVLYMYYKSLKSGRGSKINVADLPHSQSLELCESGVVFLNLNFAITQMYRFSTALFWREGGILHIYHYNGCALHEYHSYNASY
jgi:hypothetical protein